MEKRGEGIEYLFKKSLALALCHQSKIGITHTSDGIRITEENKCDPVIQKEIYEDWKKNSGQYDPKNDVIPEWEMDALHPRTVNDIKFEQYLLREYGMTKKEEIEKTFGGNVDALLKMSTIFDVFTLGTAAVAKLTGKKVLKEVGEEVGEKAVKTVAGETSEILEKNAVDDIRYKVGKSVPPIEKTLDHYLNPEGYVHEVVEKYGINLRGSGKEITIKYNSELVSAGKSRKLTPTVIEVGPQAFVSEEELANTIAHELNHARDWLKGGNAPDWPTEVHPGAYSAGDSLAEYIRGER